MLSNPSTRRFLTQTSLLTLGTFLIFFLWYGIPAASAVIASYYDGGAAFVQGQSPYAATLKQGAGHQFKYSPLFAVLMAPMARVKAQSIAIGVWIAIGMATFYAGLSRWINLTGSVRLWMAVAFVVCLFELTFSLIIGQVNALIIGLLLLGLAEYRDKRYFSAGVIILLATNLKVYPVVFLLALATRLRPRYLLGAFAMGLVAFLLPACAVGWSKNLQTHLEWVRLVTHDTASEGTLDVVSTFVRAGFGGFGFILRNFVLIATVPVFFGYIWRAKNLHWPVWMTFGIAALLLLSPRTESFTYVLLVPSFLMMVGWCSEAATKSLQRYGAILCVALAVLIMSTQFTTRRWLSSFEPVEICRVLGALGFWIFCGVLLCKEWWRERSDVSEERGVSSSTRPHPVSK